MNKNELVSEVAGALSISKVDAARNVDAVLEVIKKALGSEEEVRLIGFGTFSVSRREATTGRNPQTGRPIQIKAYKQPRFRPGKGLKDAVNKRSASSSSSARAKRR